MSTAVWMMLIILSLDIKAALNGVTNHNFIKGVDLGCVWGGSLAAINLNDKSIITVESEL